MTWFCFWKVSSLEKKNSSLDPSSSTARLKEFVPSQMARNYVRDNVPLSRFGVLVAQLESIVASSSQQFPDPLLCFDLLSDLISAIDEEPKVTWSKRRVFSLYSFLCLMWFYYTNRFVDYYFFRTILFSVSFLNNEFDLHRLCGK